MSERTRASWMAAGIVEAPIDRVWPVLVELHPALPVAVKGAVRGMSPVVTMLDTPDGGKQRIELDPTRHSITIAGEWWYRGVYALEPHTRGSLLVYRVYNIAPGIGRWVAQLMQGPQHARGMRQHIASLLRLVGDRLECQVTLLTV